ncbi:MAG: hypothetical protein MUW56_05620 [Chryseobacterium sp.]|uniref:hypothetical protein n=1 Tax=Chryseobacterium sp. TaxID=1871047 RepID=UPI0025C6B35F|nr:hypothetical protein [Chryseobacterium sp.]MCJ7933113.1 hypothetical protein [Chryseobacterium sp.]
MTTLNREDYMLPHDQCSVAAATWNEYLAKYSKVGELIPTNNIFEISRQHLDWMKNNSQYNEFCIEVGVHEAHLILIFYPMSDTGRKIDDKEAYPFSVLCRLDRDIRLQEVQEYSIVKNAILSKDLQNVDKEADMSFPVSGKPILEQDKALEAIEKWRDEGMDWFYRECTEFGGARIFRRFYVPTEDLCLNNPGLTNIVCSFGLKYNDVYERMLVTLIFISFNQALENVGGVELESNTYDWAKPCPPICRIPYE